MNKFRQGLIIIFSSIGICLSHTAFAVDNHIPTTATANFDWSHLELSVSGVGGAAPTVAFSNYKTTLDSSSSYPQGSESNAATRNDWTSTAQTETSAGASGGKGFASSEIFSGTADALGADSAANSSGSRTVDFTFDGPGVLKVSVPYTMSLTGTRDAFVALAIALRWPEMQASVILQAAETRAPIPASRSPSVLLETLQQHFEKEILYSVS